MKSRVFYACAFTASFLLLIGLATYPQDASPSPIFILAAAVLGAIAYFIRPELPRPPDAP